jgi:hypothetical protein
MRRRHLAATARRIVTFLAPRDSSRWLTLLRIGLGVHVVAYALALRPDWYSLLSSGQSAVVSRDLQEALLSLDSPWIPRVGWLVTIGRHIDLSEHSVLNCIWWAIQISGYCIVIGLHGRLAAAAAWFFHLCVSESMYLFSYGADTFTTIGLFYLMLSPLPDALSIVPCSQDKLRDRSLLLGFWRRVLQIHLCLVYASSGMVKALGMDWWTGASLWRALTNPPIDIFMRATFLPHVAHLLPAFGIAVWLLELSYPIFIWNQQTRPILLAAIIIMHISIGVLMGMWWFASIMIILNFSAFGTDYTPTLIWSSLGIFQRFIRQLLFHRREFPRRSVHLR